MQFVEISKGVKKPLHNALKGHFSGVKPIIPIARVRYFPAPPYKTANALYINVLAFFFFGFSRLFPEISDFLTKNPAKSHDLGGFTLIHVA